MRSASPEVDGNSLIEMLGGAASLLDQLGAAGSILQPRMFDVWKDELMQRRALLKLMGLATTAGVVPALDRELTRSAKVTPNDVQDLDHLADRLPGSGHGEEAVDLEFIRGLPADSVSGLDLGDVVPASFAAVAHLAPGLRSLSSVFLDGLGDDAPSVIAELTALESLALGGDDDGPSRLDDHALSATADLPALEYLSLLGGSYAEHGLQQLRRLPKLRHLHIEREGLTPPMFRFAAAMPALTRLTGLDEFGDDGPMPPAEGEQVRAMLPHICMD